MSRYCSATISVVCFGSNCNTKMVIIERKKLKVCIIRYFGPFSGRAWPDLGIEIKYLYYMRRKGSSTAKCLFTLTKSLKFTVFLVLKGKL
jgi:hypothetical protein